MKISGRKAKRIMLGLMLCGSFASTAHAGLTYTTYEVTEKTETVTYTDASGVEHTYSYTTKVATPTEAEVTGLTYESPTEGTNEIYYAWTEDGFVQVKDASLADVTVKYGENAGGFYNDGVDYAEHNGQDITGDFVADHHDYTGGNDVSGGAIEQRAGSGVTAALGNITGNFIGNYEYGANTEYGGAIYSLAGSGGIVIVGDVTGNFIGNYIDSTVERSSSYNAGGAILNYGYGEGSWAYMGNITGDFIGNYSKVESLAEGASTSSAGGGAIMNRTCNEDSHAKMGNITGNFIGNYVYAADSNAHGGAIANFSQGPSSSAEIGYITGDFIANYVYNSAGSAMGGAIDNSTQYENSAAGIGNITGNFYGNYAESSETSADGGAIYNYAYGEKSTASIGDITGNFYGNYAASSGTWALGGAIYNYAYGEESTAGIGDITGDFIGNYAESSGTYAAGGAIFNSSRGDNSTASIGDITGDFIGNYAEASGTYAIGGAIHNSSQGDNSNAGIGDIKGDFIGNHAASAKSYAVGGAICNYTHEENSTASIGAITGDFIGNYAESSGTYARGGAIFNQADGVASNSAAKIGAITGDFIGNYATSTESYAWGGAIFNRSNAENSTASIGNIEGDFIGNWAAAKEEALGGAIYNSDLNSYTGTKAEIGSIKGDFIGNYVTSEASYAYGGAIYNEVISSGHSVEIGAITGDFIGNYAKASSGEAYGGAIYNRAAVSDGTAKIDGITGDFTGNYAASESSYAKGGAIYNAGTLGDITGDFIANYAQSTTGESTEDLATGGAIYNDGTITSITGDFAGNYVEATGGGSSAAGGAIYNYNSGTIASITGTFTENTAGDGDGGAIFNRGTIKSITDSTFEGNTAGFGGAIFNWQPLGGGGYGTIESITGSTFTENKADYDGGAIFVGFASHIEKLSGSTFTGNTAGYGGAIFIDYTDSYIGEISGSTFTGNYAVSENGNAYGGAIYNGGNGDGIGSINGGTTFSGNYARSGSGEAKGGAIYNGGTIGEMVLDGLSGNYAEGTTSAMGGAIYDETSTITVTGDVTGNYVKTTSGEALGGAIYAGEDTVVTLSGNITGNSATGDTALGGAIYNAGIVNINIENQDAVISGNYTEAGGTQEANVLYGEAASVTNFSLTDATLRLDDSVTGETGFEVNVTGSGTDATTFYMYNDILDSNLSIGGTTLNTINGEAHTYNVNQFTVAGDFDMQADISLGDETMDRFVTNGNSYGEAQGTLNVSALNVVKDTAKTRVGVYFAEPGLKEDVTSSVSDVMGPVNTYSVSYDKNYDGSWGDDGGYFVFDKTGNNPAAMIPSIAQMGAFNAMNMMFEYCFEHSDYYMKLPSETRLAIREKAKAAKAAKLAAKNGTTAEEETKKIDDAREEEMASREGVKFYDHDNVLPRYDQHELTRPGAWVKPFATRESIPFTGKFTARDKYYGALIGVDSDFRENKKGWGSVFTGYAGYQGIHQNYTGGSVRQDGGLLGATETFYKKNFYTAWTIAAASTRAKARNMYGHENSHLYTYGIATKSGWNLEYDGGKYTVLPTFMASYTTVDMRSYTNAAGLRVDADDMRAVQLNPNIKWIRNYSNGWQPYLTAGEIWTVAQKSRVRVGGIKLDELHLRPYTEYGIGVQKRWANEYDGYAQFLGHAGGRRGWLINLGFRWTF